LFGDLWLKYLRLYQFLFLFDTGRKIPTAFKIRSVIKKVNCCSQKTLKKSSLSCNNMVQRRQKN
jgi:hypothetical protein